MSLYQKILELQKSISYVQKDKKNDHFKYKYVSESALVDKCMKEINGAGLIVLPSLTNLAVLDICGKPSATVNYSYRVIDVESKEEVTMDAGGFEQGDKCAFKAMTGANKYFLLRFLQIATGDDPEKEEKPAAAKKEGITDKQNADLDCQLLLTKIIQFIRKYGIDSQKLHEIAGVVSVKGINDFAMLEIIYSDLQRWAKQEGAA